ncbi:MAG: hypothetical protein WBW79_04175 [Desulfocapsaceae bacterium]|jgi:hypothetical protein
MVKENVLRPLCRVHGKEIHKTHISRQSGVGIVADYEGMEEQPEGGFSWLMQV